MDFNLTTERRAANQDWLVNRLIGIVTRVRDGTWNDDDVAYEAAAIRDQIEPARARRYQERQQT